MSLRLDSLSSFFFASILAAITGIATDRLVYHPLRKKSAPPLVFLIDSFGIFIFLQNLLQLLYGAQILTLRTSPVTEGIHILSVIISSK
jgi:branched-chain amino acid transport system permease protein